MVKHKVFYAPTLNIQLDDKAINEREQRLSELGNLSDGRTVKGRMGLS
ncbi:MAG: hypothetical protein GY850_31145 [bacterium]|nr:hypothetical protein [bacterium]